MNPAFVKSVYYPLIFSLKSKKTLLCLKELENSQWYSSEQMRELQWKKISSILRHSFSNIPYYRKKFKEIGLEPRDIKSLEDFTKLPVLTKEELIEHCDELIDKGYKGKKISGRTSGSTGLPIQVFYDLNFTSWTSAAQWRGRRWLGVDFGDRQLAVWGRPIDSRIKKWLGYMKSRLKNVLLISAFDLSEEKLQFYWGKIRSFYPDYIYGYATAIWQLLQYISQQSDTSELHPKTVISTAETMYPYQKDYIKTNFGCAVREEYGCSETGAFAFECDKGGLHISVENVLVEFLKNGKPVSLGMPGEVVVTTLNNYYMPLLRYTIGDIGLLISKKKCQCGRNLPLMELTVSKITDMVITPGGRTFSSELFNYINLGLMKRGLKGIKQFRVIQETVKDLIVEIIKDNQFDSQSVDYFIKKTKEFLGDVNVKTRFVEVIPRDSAGKLRYFVCKTQENG